jgi:hypothetical protein
MVIRWDFEISDSHNERLKHMDLLEKLPERFKGSQAQKTASIVSHSYLSQHPFPKHSRLGFCRESVGQIAIPWKSQQIHWTGSSRSVCVGPVMNLRQIRTHRQRIRIFINEKLYSNNLLHDKSADLVPGCHSTSAHEVDNLRFRKFPASVMAPFVQCCNDEGISGHC